MKNVMKSSTMTIQKLFTLTAGPHTTTNLKHNAIPTLAIPTQHCHAQLHKLKITQIPVIINENIDLC